jgi:hypothetical protein
VGERSAEARHFRGRLRASREREDDPVQGDRVAAERYALRAGSRDAGHFDASRATGELWNDEVARPVAGGWPVIDVDTAVSFDLEALTAAIRAAAGIGLPG